MAAPKAQKSKGKPSKLATQTQPESCNKLQKTVASLIKEYQQAEQSINESTADRLGEIIERAMTTLGIKSPEFKQFKTQTGYRQSMYYKLVVVRRDEAGNLKYLKSHHCLPVKWTTRYELTFVDDIKSVIEDGKFIVGDSRISPADLKVKDARTLHAKPRKSASDISTVLSEPIVCVVEIPKPTDVSQLDPVYDYIQHIESRFAAMFGVALDVRLSWAGIPFDEIDEQWTSDDEAVVEAVKERLLAKSRKKLTTATA
jgi:hypothetical protein